MYQSNAIKVFFFFWGLTALSGCLSESKELASRPLIQRYGAEAQDMDGPCTDFYDITVTNGSCIKECRSGTRLGSTADRDQLIGEIENSDQPEEEKETLLANISSAKGLCLPGDGPLRPHEDIFVNGDFCICKNGRPDSVGGRCEAFCSKRGHEGSVLYGSVRLGNKVANHPKLGNLKNWCEVPLFSDSPTSNTSGNLGTPGCTLVLTSAEGGTSLSIDIEDGSNYFSANLSSVPYDTPFVARIVESNSGSNVSSKPFHIYRKKYEEENNDFPVGALTVTPIHQYTCIHRSGTFSSPSPGRRYTTYKHAIKKHYYYAPPEAPKPLEPGSRSGFVFCHDKDTYGEDDSLQFERLELIPGHLTLWNRSDIRFYDRDRDQRPDINTHIEERLRDEYNISSSINLFTPFRWYSRPPIADYSDNPEKSNSTSVVSNLGFIMQPWSDPTSRNSFCPTQKHYNGNKPVFRILREIVGVDTEGIYTAESEPFYSVEGDRILTVSPDILLIREGLLKQIWFYLKNGRPIEPTEDNASHNTLHFYWPPDPKYPYNKKPTQRLYTVRAPGTVLGRNSDVPELESDVTASDRRFGCIPTSQSRHD